MIHAKVEKLLEAKHIKEVQFLTCLSNVVLVSKSSGQWRMCVDFHSLNKVCLKDCYPLSRIDQLVDLTTSYDFICIMDIIRSPFPKMVRIRLASSF